jgi:protein-tyrosine-phosphatase
VKHRRTKVLFLCIGNACRSQIAEALARKFGGDFIEAQSAGVAPLGMISKFVWEVLQERGCIPLGQYSKAISDLRLFKPDMVVNLTGSDVAHMFPGLRVLNWLVDDPHINGPIEAFRRTCVQIDQYVMELIQDLRTNADR